MGHCSVVQKELFERGRLALPPQLSGFLSHHGTLLPDIVSAEYNLLSDCQGQSQASAITIYTFEPPELYNPFFLLKFPASGTYYSDKKQTNKKKSKKTKKNLTCIFRVAL